MDVINENSAQNIGRNHQSVTNNIARMMGLAIANLLESLAHRLNRKLTKVVEVKINDKLVFRGEADRKPEINKFTPQHIKALESLLATAKTQPQKTNDTLVQKPQVKSDPTNTPQTTSDLESIIASAKAQNDPEKINEIQILVGGQSVYHSKDGNELVNQLNSNSPQESQDTKAKVETPLQNEKDNSYQVEGNSSFSQEQLKQNVNHLSIVAAANKILELKGATKIENNIYSIERSNNSLVVTAKDGRGEIAKVDSVGQVSGSNLLPGETKVFNQAVKNLELQVASANVSPQATQKVEQVASPVEENEQVKNVEKPKVQVATASKSQPDEELEI